MDNEAAYPFAGWCLINFFQVEPLYGLMEEREAYWR